MGFNGNLKTMNLGDVFQNVLQHRSTGNLKISTKELGLVNLFFMDGNLCLFHTSNLEEIQWSRVLLAKDEMTQDEVDIIESQGIRGEDELAGIISSSIITEDNAAIHLQGIVEEQIYELFMVSEGEFSFEIMNEIPTIYSYQELFKRTLFQTNALLMEAARRADEISNDEGGVSSNEIFVQDKVKAEENSFHIDEGGWKVFDLVDGIRNVSEIVRDTGGKRNDIVKSIKALLEIEAIRHPGSKDLLDKASHLCTIQDYESAAKIYRRLIDVEKAVLTHRNLLADTFLKLQQKENAIMQLEIMASEYALRKEFKKSIEVLKKITEIDSSKLNSRLQMADVLLEMGRKKDAVSELKHVLQAYVDAGVFEKAKETCAKLLDIDPNDLKILELMAKTNMARGDRDNAIDVWLKMGTIYNGLENYEEAADIYRKIIKVEPNHEKAKEILNELMVLMGKARTRKKIYFIVGGVLTFSILVIALLFYFDRKNNSDLKDLKEKNSIVVLGVDQASSKEEAIDALNGVLKSYEDFVKNHKLSFTFLEINELRNKVLLKRTEIQKKFEDRHSNEISKMKLEAKELLIESDSGKPNHLIKSMSAFVDKIKEFKEMDEYAHKISGKIQYLEGIEKDAKALFGLILKEEESKNYEKCNKHVKHLLELYARTEWAQKAKFVLHIDSSEKECELKINDKLISSKLPYTYHYSTGSANKIVVSKNGYEDHVLSVQEGKIGMLDLFMKRKVLWTYEIGNPLKATPFFQDQVLYLASRNGRIAALSVDFKTNSKKEIWSYKLKYPGSDILCKGFFDADTMYIGSSDGHIYAFSNSAGRPRWSKKTVGPINSGVFMSQVRLKQQQKMVFAASAKSKNSGLLSGFDAETGKVEWETQIEGRYFTDVVSSGAQVYVGSDQNRIFAYKAATGKPVKVLNADGESVDLVYKGYGAFKGRLVLVGKKESPEFMISSCTDQNVYCFDVNTGDVAWLFHTNSPNENGVQFNGTDLIFNSSDGTVYSLDLEKSKKGKRGIAKWVKHYGDFKDPGQVCITEKVVYVGGATKGNKGKLLAIRKSDGKLLWTFSAPKPINCEPLVISNRIFIGCDNGKLYALDVLN